MIRLRFKQYIAAIDIIRQLLIICLIGLVLFTPIRLSSTGRFTLLPSCDFVTMPSSLITSYHFFKKKISVDFYVPDGIIGEELVIFKPSVDERLRDILNKYSFVKKARISFKINRLPGNSFEIDDVSTEVEIFDFNENNILIPEKAVMKPLMYSEYQEAFVQMILRKSIIYTHLNLDIDYPPMPINITNLYRSNFNDIFRNYIESELSKLIMDDLSVSLLLIDSFPLVKVEKLSFKNFYSFSLEFINQIF